jgi:hypothetical protein
MHALREGRHAYYCFRNSELAKKKKNVTLKLIECNMYNFIYYSYLIIYFYFIYPIFYFIFLSSLDISIMSLNITIASYTFKPVFLFQFKFQIKLDKSFALSN